MKMKLRKLLECSSSERAHAFGSSSAKYNGVDWHAAWVIPFGVAYIGRQVRDRRAEARVRMCRRCLTFARPIAACTRVFRALQYFIK